MIDWSERGNASDPALRAMVGRPQVERVVASIAFSATSFLVVGTLAAAMEPGRYAAVGLVWVTASVANNFVRYGLFDATLSGRVSIDTCRHAVQRLARVVMAITSLATLVAGIVWSDPLAAAVIAGAGLNLTADLARMVGLCDGQGSVVARRDVAWLAGTALLAGLTWGVGSGSAVGSVGGWIAGGAGWTVLALRASRPAVTTQTGERGLLAGTWPMAASGTGPFVGYLFGMAAVAAVGRPSAAAVMEIGRLVGMPALTVYSGLRLAVVADATGVPRSPRHPSTGLEPGPERSPVAMAALVVSGAIVVATVAAALVVPADSGSALDVARRWWPLIAASQVARLVASVVSDAVRPLLGDGAGMRLGVISVVLGTLVPPALVLVLGDAGGPVSQLAIAALVGAWIANSLRTSPLAHRRTMRGPTWR